MNIIIKIVNWCDVPEVAELSKQEFPEQSDIAAIFSSAFFPPLVCGTRQIALHHLQSFLIMLKHFGFGNRNRIHRKQIHVIHVSLAWKPLLVTYLCHVIV